MKRIGFICLIIGAGCIVLILAIYGSRGRESQKVLARINNYVMTVEDFKDEIKYSPYAGDETLDIQRLLDLAIRKQVLIQEAQRRRLDREKTFMKTIERYWEQTLIKELLEKETRRIYETVSEDKQAEVSPFVDLLLDVRKQLRDEKLWALSDLVRDQLKALGVIIEDSKEGTTWRWE